MKKWGEERDRQTYRDGETQTEREGAWKKLDGESVCEREREIEREQKKE